MISLQRGIAVVCVSLLLAPIAGAQTPVIQSSGGPFSGFVRPYHYQEIAPVNLANSTRLDQLLRGGNIYLSLQDAIALALENNLDIAIQRYTPVTASANLLRAKSGGLLRGVPSSVQSATTNVLTQLTGNSSGGSSGGSSSSSAGGAIITQTGTAVPNLDPSVYLVGSFGHQSALNPNSVMSGTTSTTANSRYWASGYSQGFLTGTDLSLGWSGTSVRSNVPRADFNPYTTSGLSLSISQPLLQGFGFAVNNRNIRIAKNTIATSDLTFKLQVISTVASIIGGYWDLVSATENVKVQEQALALSRKLYEDNKKQVEIGTLAPIEVVRAESEVASNEQQLIVARTTVLQQETALKNALSRTGVASVSIADAHIIPTDHIRVPEKEATEPVQDLVAKALDKRPEIAQTRINIESTKIGLIGTKHEMLPSLGLQASFKNSGLAGQAISPLVPGFFLGGMGTALKQVFSRNFPDYSLGFQLNVPLRNRAAQADMINDQVNLRTQELTQQRQINAIRLDVRNALIALDQARAGYEAAVKSRVLAEQVLDAEQKKYALGASTIYFVIQYQRDLARARSTEVAAESTYAKAKVQLDQAVGTTLENNNVSLDEARQGKVSAAPSPLPAEKP